jgi:serine/threonine-protein kinase
MNAPVPRLTDMRPELPAALQPIIARVLAKDPAARYPTAGAFAAALVAASQGAVLADARALPRTDGAAPEHPGTELAAIPDEVPAYAPPRPEQPAEKIGRYHRERIIGRGGMAVVYLAYDPVMERHVAIKVLSRELADQPAFMSRLQYEAELVAALEHDGIVRVYDLGEHAGQPFIVMQYMPGDTLMARLRNGPLPLAFLARVVEPIARGLDMAHQRNIIHQDIKPANILFDRWDNALLSDFGIAVATRVSSGRRHAVAGGTPLYMSPEQALAVVGAADSRSAITYQSDIYALGVVVFQAMVGHVPFYGNTSREIALAHLKQPVPRLHDIQPALPIAAQAVLERALAKDPASRYATASELAQAVRALVPRHGDDTTL